MLIKARLTSDIFKEKSHLTADASSGDATITVKSINDFSTDQAILIGELGSENAEVISTHSATSPTGNTVTLDSTLSNDHPSYTKVTILQYDQVKFFHSPTQTGSKSVLATKDINGDQKVIFYDDTANSSGYYFVRYIHSVSSETSEFTDPIPFAGLDEGTVGSAINYALKRNGKDDFTGVIDYSFCIEEVNNCLQFVTDLLKRWTKLQKFDEILGQTTRGEFIIDLPDDIWEDESFKSILDVRIGDEPDPLSPITKRKFEEKTEDLKYTQVRTEASSGDTTLDLDNSYDFDDTGSIDVFISGTKHNITYTGVTRDDSSGSTAQLTGIPASGDGSITVTIPVDTYVYQDEDEGQPVWFTVYGGKIRIWPLPSASYDNNNVYMDYFTAPTKVDSDADVVDAYRYTMIKYWLVWAIRSQLSNPRGKRDKNDNDYQMFLDTLRNYVRNEIPAHNKRRRRNWSGIDYGGRRSGIGR